MSVKNITEEKYARGILDINLKIKVETYYEPDCMKCFGSDGRLILKHEVYSDMESALEDLVISVLEKASLKPVKICIV